MSRAVFRMLNCCYAAALVRGLKSGLGQVLIFKWLFPGECCVALRSLAGASEQFETFLCHRGEEMGSIRGRVRIHVPKDRRGTREKTYGETAASGSSPASSRPRWASASCWTFASTCWLCPLSLSPASLTFLPLFGSSLVPGLGFYTCWYLATLPLSAPHALKQKPPRETEMRTDVCIVSRSEATTTCTSTAMLNKFSGTKHTHHW